LARQNVVLPVLSRFGKFLKTHRLLRQYLWIGILPYVFATVYTNSWFSNQTEALWAVHAKRLNEKYSFPDKGSFLIPWPPSTRGSCCR
jgi:hypothetical protein